ncbi:MAG: SIMPL domain-containing protein [Gammaproteobacteria bacterium]|nr:SIMPL domain-containing protein [Gammaproteobacteria bacterium]
MQTRNTSDALLLGLCLLIGLGLLGYLLGDAAIRYKEYERTVIVKGLSEREFPADIVIWPIQFTSADNDLESLYQTIEINTGKISDFLLEQGIAAGEISATPPTIVDKAAQRFGDGPRSEFRYSAVQAVTVYSSQVERVRAVMSRLATLGRQGIAFTGGDYENQTEYLFTRLNEVKPEMIQEATTKAREVAETFAHDSNSRLGKIRQASQGQFSIEARDKNNPHIKKVRVVSTVEYYLSD